MEEKLVATFEKPVLFTCLEDCGLCCSYKVHLLRGDIEIIEQCAKSEEAFVEDECLVKDHGFCVFLNSDCRCTIYDSRPWYCRTFPFYVESNAEIDIDLTCPGIGHGDVLVEEWFERLFWARNKQVRTNCANLLSELFVVSGRIDGFSQDDFKEIGLRWCEAMKQVHSIAEIISSALDCAKKESLVFPMVPQLRTSPIEINKAANVHLSADGKPTRYSCQVCNEKLTIDEREHRLDHRLGNFDDIDQRGLKVICEYLMVWFRRSIFYRFCVVNSLQAPMLASPFTIAFEFVADLVERVELVANVLGKHWSQCGERTEEVEILKEAIRMFDGKLRTKCRTAIICSE